MVKAILTTVLGIFTFTVPSWVRLLNEGEGIKLEDADVLVVDPTHYAVALFYSSNDHNAPIIVEKGKDILALGMKKLARLSSIHIAENPPLARALYDLDVGEEIDESLYAPVAELLAYVYNKDIQRIASYLKVRGVILYQKEIRV